MTEFPPISGRPSPADCWVGLQTIVWIPEGRGQIIHQVGSRQLEAEGPSMLSVVPHSDLKLEVDIVAYFGRSESRLCAEWLGGWVEDPGDCYSFVRSHQSAS